MRRLPPLLIATLLGAADPGCGEPEVEPTSAASVVASPEFLIAGCEGMTPGPVCLVPANATLRLWVAAHRNARLVVEQSGKPLAATWTAAEDGLRTTWTPDEPAGTLELRDVDAGWRVRIELQPAPGLSPTLQLIEQRSIDGDHAGAAQRLAAELPGLTGADRAMALKLIGDNEFRRDDLPAMRRAYDDAFADMVATGLLRSANAMALTVVYLCLLHLDDRACARRWRPSS